MRIKHPIVQAAVLVVASMAVAVIANGFAGRTRRLVLPGWYPNAMTAPTRAPQVASTATTEQSPAPGNPPIVVPTATITNTAAPSDTAAQPHSDPAAPTTTGQPVNPTTTQPPTQQPSTPATPQPPAVNLAKFTPHPDKAYVEISGEDAVALHRAGTLFLDARRSSIFEEGHIPGSRSFSVWEADVDDKVTALFEERQDPAEQNKPIVIYCSGGACEDSHMLAQKLWGVQFNNVYVYKDGFPDWQKRNLPVNKGANP
jgi:rhodanese-related sulfurtransferase